MDLLIQQLPEQCHVDVCILAPLRLTLELSHSMDDQRISSAPWFNVYIFFIFWQGPGDSFGRHGDDSGGVCGIHDAR